MKSSTAGCPGQRYAIQSAGIADMESNYVLLLSLIVFLPAAGPWP